MATYYNPDGSYVGGTPDADTFTFDRPFQDLVVIDALAGTDRLIVDIPVETEMYFSAEDTFNSGTFYGQVLTGPYDPTMLFYNVEDVTFAGRQSDDMFRLKIGDDTSTLSVDFDGQGGTDTLSFDWSRLTHGMSFVVDDGSITSGFGSFANIEKFSIYAGSGNDEIRTGDENDYIATGTGSDTVVAGGGDDQIYSESSGGMIDGGSGQDYWGGNLSTTDLALTVSMGDAITVSTGLTVTNVEDVSLGTGLGDDHIDITHYRPGVLDGSEGTDTLTYDVPADPAQQFTVYGYGDGLLYGSIGELAFDRFENVDFHGGDNDDSFTVGSAFANGSVHLDGGGGTDELYAQFDQFGTSTRFIVHEDGSIDSNRGTFANFENFIVGGGTAADTLITGSGNDYLSGDAGRDVLEAGDGNDVLNGQTDADTMFGGRGNDIYYVDNVLDRVVERDGEGVDEVVSSVSYSLAGQYAENLSLTFYESPIAATGNGLANTLTGNDADNILDGGAGADTMVGGFGDDTYIVDNAADKTIEDAYRGTDRVQSSVSFTLGDNIENLTLTGTGSINGTGNALVNQLTGNAGDNLLDGGKGADAMAGGDGNDTYVVDTSHDQVIETATGGTDLVRSAVNLVLAANVENLTLTGSANISGTGNALANVIIGNSGDNRIDGKAGADAMTGGSGNDTYVVDNAGDKVIEASASGGTDVVESSISYTLGNYVEKLTLAGTAAINGTGNGLANTIAGNGAANVLDGGAGADTMSGGSGNDTYVVDNAGDKALETSASGGTDLVQSAISYTIGDYIEKLTLTGTAAINGTGNSLDNSIAGNAAANIIDGGKGADTMSGGGGNDTYMVDSSHDTVIETSGGGTDLVRSAVSHTLANYVENLTLTGSANTSGTGNGLANVITGNSGDNRIDGKAGADTMSGGGGNDHYFVDNAGDKVIEASASGGTDSVDASISYTLGDYVEHLTLSGSTAINGAGNALANAITGNSGANTLDGGDGNDVLTGGKGADSFLFDTRLNAGSNVDNILDFSANDDTIVLDRSIFTKLGADGTLAASAFHAGTSAGDASDRIVYDQASGNIFYDADGSGHGAQVLFAHVDSGVPLTNADFHVIA